MAGPFDASTLITRLAGRAASIFYDLERIGGPIPDGPVLVVANHPNSLLDPLIVFRTAGRPTRPLAKAPLFDQAIVGSMLRGLGGLPVYRRQDDPAQMHRNDATFDAAIGALRAGDAVQIFPEGLSHSEPGLAPLRTGAARIALGAEAASGWTLGLRIVPIGLTYRRKALFRGDALAVIGEPFDIAELRAPYESDPTEAVRALTAEIGRRLEAVTLSLTSHEDQTLIDTADRLYTREKGVHGWREREELRDRFPRLQLFARGLALLRAADPERHDRLAHAVRRYHRHLQTFGAAEGDVPPEYRPASVLRYTIVEGVLLAVGFPLAAIGAVLWYPAWIAPRFVVRAIRPDPEAVATYKLAGGFFAVLVWQILLVAGAGLLWGIAGAAIATAALPFLAALTLAWGERWRRVREDALLFFRTLGRERGLDRFAAQRAMLTREFDDVLDEMTRESPPATAVE
jgi:1-acyl-sn-glycerol-3-phosphate acyltransferase